MSILLDTGVLFAFLHADDERHERARELMQEVAEGRWGAPFTSEYVVDELFTLIRVRARNAELEAAARALLPLPDPALPGLRLLPVGVPQLPDVVAHFERHRERRLSFTDASHLVLLGAHGIEHLATFDRGFEGLASVVG